MVSVALAGFSQGYYATTYLRYLSRLKDVRILAVCTCGMDADYISQCAFVTAEQFAQELGVPVPVIEKYETLLAMKPDALLLCSETAQHADMTAQALACGIHVFVAKPLCFLAQQAEQLIAAKPKKLRVLCGNPLKYELGVEEMHKRCLSGEIGTLYSLRIAVTHEAMTQQAWERCAARSGGPLGTYGVYLFDLARFLSGVPLTRIFALSSNFATPEIECADTVKVLGQAVGGIQFTLELYSGIKHAYPFVQIEAVGTAGTLVTHTANYATVAQTQAGAALGTLRTSNMGAGEMEHFLDCVRHGAAERCGIDDMLYVAQCIEAVQESVRTGAPVALAATKEAMP